MAVTVVSMDSAFFENRLHFSFIDNPEEDRGSGADREYKDTGAFILKNTGASAISVLDVTLEGPFEIANLASLAGATIPAGGQITVSVAFDRTKFDAPTGSITNIDAAPAVFNGKVTVTTNAPGGATAVVDLSGVWQRVVEDGNEPNVNEVWEAFGFGNFIEGLPTVQNGGRSVLDTDGVYAIFDDAEVLAPYFRLADGVSSAKITQIGSFTGPFPTAVDIHNPGDIEDSIRQWRVSDTDTQQLLPNRSGNTAPASRTLTNNTIPEEWTGDGVFGIRVGTTSSDPTLNIVGRTLVDSDGKTYRYLSSNAARDENGERVAISDLDLVQQGHWNRVYRAYDSEGVAIADTYLLIHDEPDGNHDYNDVMLVIEGVVPVTFDAELAVTGFDAAAADQRLVFTNIQVPNTFEETQAIGGQVFRNTAELTLTNNGGAPLSLTDLSIVGDGAAAFTIVSAPSSIPAGGAAVVTIRFTGEDVGQDRVAERYQAELVIQSDALSAPAIRVTLAGLAQNQSELQQEPKVEDIVWAFGYGTDVAQGELRNGGRVETIGDEVLAPYMTRLDASRPVEVIQMAAFLRQNDIARLNVHGVSSGQITELYAQDDQQGQTVSPEGLVVGPGSTGEIAAATFTPDGAFGFRVTVDDRPTFAAWSDPEINRLDPDLAGLVGSDRGHLLRFFQAIDASGAAIAGTFIAIQDYPGGSNFDYQDHMFLVRNVAPYVLTAAEAGGDGVNDALQRDADGDGLVDFFDFDLEGGPTQVAYTSNGDAWAVTAAGGVSLRAIDFDRGGEGVAYHDATEGRDDYTGYRPEDSVEFTRAVDAVGYINDGEWLEYTINVAEAGSYMLSLLSASPRGGRSVTTTFAKDGVVYETATSAVADTDSFSVYQSTAAQSVDLQAGEQVLRVLFNGNRQNLKQIDLVPEVASRSGGQSAFNATGDAWLVDADTGLELSATVFDEGGQGVAYNDLSPARLDSTGFRPDVAVDFSRGAASVGYVEAGEWLEYTLFVEAAGDYALSLAMGTPNTGRTVTSSFAKGGAVYESVTSDVARTGSFKTFADTQAEIVSLQEGEQVLRVHFDQDAQDFNHFSLIAADQLI